MSLELVLVLAVVGLVAALWAAVWWLEQQMAKRGVPQVTVEVPSPVVVPAPVVQVIPNERLRRGAPLTLVLKSGSLQRTLGTVTVEDNKRPASLTWRAPGGPLGNFVADHPEADGTWVYRRVGVEREG